MMQQAAKALSTPNDDLEEAPAESKIDAKFKQLQESKELNASKKKKLAKELKLKEQEANKKEGDGEEEEAEISNKDKRRVKKDDKKLKSQFESLKCNVCKLCFDSRSKLFAHIKATGHALAK